MNLGAGFYHLSCFNYKIKFSNTLGSHSAFPLYPDSTFSPRSHSYGPRGLQTLTSAGYMSLCEGSVSWRLPVSSTEGYRTPNPLPPALQFWFLPQRQPSRMAPSGSNSVAVVMVWESLPERKSGSFSNCISSFKSSATPESRKVIYSGIPAAKKLNAVVF